jgi:hypothetical protein
LIAVAGGKSSGELIWAPLSSWRPGALGAMLKNVIYEKGLHIIRSLVDYLPNPYGNLKTKQNRMATMLDKTSPYLPRPAQGPGISHPPLSNVDSGLCLPGVDTAAAFLRSTP